MSERTTEERLRSFARLLHVPVDALRNIYLDVILEKASKHDRHLKKLRERNQRLRDRQKAAKEAKK